MVAQTNINKTVNPLEVVGRVHSLETMGTVDGPGTRMVVFCQGAHLGASIATTPKRGRLTKDNA